MEHPLADILSNKSCEQMSIIPNEIILLDNYAEEQDPLASLNTAEVVHIDQMFTCFVMQGRLKAKINGEEVTVFGGQVLTALPKSEGYFIESSEDCRFIMFIIYPDMMKRTFEDIYINYDRTIYETSFIVETCTEEQMSVYQVLYTELRKECVREPYEHRLLVVRSYLNVLFTNSIKLYDLTSGNTEKKNLADSRQYEMFQKFIEALNKHAKTERSVQFYADLLHITPKYLSYVSIQYTGKNASQWIGEYVVHHAKTLISIHHKSSAEIAEELNFPTLISYNRFFKRITGISAKEYRKGLNLKNKIKKK